MKQFDTGDRVKVIGKTLYSLSNKHIGKVGTVLDSTTFYTGCAVSVVLDNEDEFCVFEEKQLKEDN